LPGNIASTYSAIFNAHERNEIPAMLTVMTTFAKVVVGTVALVAGWGYIGLAAISILLNVMNAVSFLVISRQIFGTSLVEPEARAMAPMASEGYPLMFNSFLQTVFFKADILLLQNIQGNRAVGYYGTAYKYVDGFLILPSAFTFAIFPALSRLARERGE